MSLAQETYQIKKSYDSTYSTGWRDLKSIAKEVDSEVYIEHDGQGWIFIFTDESSIVTTHDGFFNWVSIY